MSFAIRPSNKPIKKIVVEEQKIQTHEEEFVSDTTDEFSEEEKKEPEISEESEEDENETIEERNKRKLHEKKMKIKRAEKEKAKALELKKKIKNEKATDRANRRAELAKRKSIPSIIISNMSSSVMPLSGGMSIRPHTSKSASEDYM